MSKKSTGEFLLHGSTGLIGGAVSQTSYLPEPPPEPEVPPAESDEFYTKQHSGLKAPWCGERVWLNCPYSDIEPWVVKVDREVRTDCPLVVMLLPATKTEQPWWQQYIEPYRDIDPMRVRTPDGWRGLREERLWTVETRFIAKRIRFGFPGSPDGGTSSGRFGSVLVIWRRA